MGRKIVITGASGQLGRMVSAEIVQRRGPDDDVWLCSRRPELLREIYKQVHTAHADFDDIGSLEGAFADADVVLLISSNGPAQVRLAQHGAAIEACRRAGVGRLIYTSFVGAREDSPSKFAVVHHASEQAVFDTGLPYTILRVNQYAEVIDTCVACSFGTGKLGMPAADARVGYIPRADVAAAIAGAVLGAGHENKTYNLTAKTPLNLHEMAEIVSKARNQQIEVIDADPWQYVTANLLPFGVPQHIIEGMAGTYAAAAQGDYDVSGEDAEQLAGRVLGDFSDYLRTIA